MTDFNGRTILVTGASGGIGGETVRQLITAGADVIAAGRSEEALGKLAAETGARPLPFDLTSEDSVRDALADLDVWGVVNCGGFGGEIATPMETDISVFDQVTATNSRGVLLVTKYTSRSMIRLGRRRRDRQRVLPGRPGRAQRPHLVRLVQGRRRQHHPRLRPRARPHNIRVNSVNPTVVMTPMSAWYWGRPDIEGPFLAAMPLGRWATEAEIAAPIVFLLSDGASMISGVTLPIDGGYTCR